MTSIVRFVVAPMFGVAVQILMTQSSPEPASELAVPLIFFKVQALGATKIEN